MMVKQNMLKKLWYLKNLSKFWRTFEMPYDCEINLILNWSVTCVIA